MLIPQEIIENVRESSDIVDVISEYVPLQKRGKNYFGLCPFHKEKTPSFSVQQDKQIYHCFGCGEGGNVFSFIMKYHNIGFVDAVKRLAERANIIIPENGAEEDPKKAYQRKKLLEISREAAIFFYINLQNSRAGLEYLKKRGISSDIIKKFGLGFAPDGWDNLLKHLKSKGYEEDLIEKTGLIIKKNGPGFYDRFRNRVIFPVLDVKSRVIGFGGRVLDDSKPKYLNSPETLIFNKGSNLYGLNFAKENDSDKKVIIVEGYMDVIALHQYGIKNAVASLGTALTKGQAKLLKRYFDEVLICYDADTAGQAATLRGLDILADAGCNVRILNIPKGKDPDEYIRAEGKEAFLNLIENAQSLIEYKIKRKSEGFDLSTTEGKISFIKSCSNVLAEIEDPIKKDAYIAKLSADTGISVSAIYEEVANQRKKEQNAPIRHINGKTRYNNNYDGQKLYLEPAYLKAEKFMLYILYEKREKFNLIKNSLSWDDFNDDVYKEAARLMYEKLNCNEEIIPAAIIDHFQDADSMKKISDAFSMDVAQESGDLDRMLEDCIKLINRRKLMRKKDLLVLKMRDYEKVGDMQQSAKLLDEIIKIERQLREV